METLQNMERDTEKAAPGKGRRRRRDLYALSIWRGACSPSKNSYSRVTTGMTMGLRFVFLNR